VSTTPKSDAAAARGYRIPADSPWARAWRVAAMIGALGLGIAAYGWWRDPERFVFSYLFGFYVALCAAVGSVFFVLILYVSKASWGVTVRRVAELFARPMAMFALLVIPLIAYPPIHTGGACSSTEACPTGAACVDGHCAGHFDPLVRLFPWARPASEASEAGEESLAEARGIEAREPTALREMPYVNAQQVEGAGRVAEALVVEHKRFYLSRPFFLTRLVAYLLIWWLITYFYFGWSVDQDASKAPRATALAQRYTPLAIILFALSLSFFAFDWLLSLDATWYSTIFGVYVFAQCTLFQMACLVVMTLALKRSGLLGEAVNVEHFHDMGKLLFGWIAFWTYISFAQFFLTWYSNIPDEVAWFHKRWDGNGGGWMSVSVTLVVLHFFVPFWFLMSRNIKRNLPLLGVGAASMIVMHVIEAYWIIMPNFGPLAPSLLDFGCLIGIVGVYLAAVLRGMTDYALVPLGDPRLQRALEFENA
jgi:hypothetical protein